MKSMRLAVLAGALFVSNMAFAGNTLEVELGAKLDAFARAVQAGDSLTAQGLLSKEMLARIATRGRSANYAENLKAFVAREQVKINRELGDLSNRSEGFSVVAVEPQADGRTVSAFVALGGQTLPKPFFFVYEDGQYKLNIVKPTKGDFSTASTDNYAVKNDDGTARAIYCRGSSANVAAFQSVTIPCSDTCNWFYSSTRFTVGGRSADCDWNTWGYDVYIRYNSPVCNDPC